MNLLQKALEIATTAHKGQKDKGGNDYILHPLSVSCLVKSHEAKIVAILHDTIEDTDVTLETLKKAKFPNRILHSIDCLTRREDESRMDYLLRVKADAVATEVKIADLQHNSDISRIPNPTQKDMLRAEQYAKEIEFLKSSN